MSDLDAIATVRAAVMGVSLITLFTVPYLETEWRGLLGVAALLASIIALTLPRP